MNQTPYPIYCIDHQSQTLYVELIQVVESRQLAWVRPLMLLASGEMLASTLYGRQEEADLLCPLPLLRQALDTEVIPLLSKATQLSDSSLSDSDTDDRGLGDRGWLHRFLQKVCVDNPGLFQSSEASSSD